MLDGKHIVRVWHNHSACLDVFEMNEVTDEHFVFEADKPPRIDFDANDWISETVRRICPAVKEVLLVPELRRISDKIIFGGFCHGTEKIVLSCGGRRINNIMQTTYHELCHACDSQLNDEYRQWMYATIYSRATRFGDPEYIDTPIEQVARAFDCFAMSLHNGLTFATNHDEILAWFGRVYTGAWAKQVAIWAEEDRIAQAKKDRHKRIRDAVFELTGF